MRQNTKWCALFVAIYVCAGCSKKSAPVAETTRPSPEAPPSAPPAAPTPAPLATATPPGRGVKTEMRNVNFHLTDQAIARLEYIRGEIWPTGKNEMPVFDDKTSFEVRVTSGKISLTSESLANILNNHVFARSDAALKNISISVDKNGLILKGRLHNKGDIPFETAGVLSVNPDGRIRVVTQKVKALKVPVKGVMGLFGIELAKMLDTSKIEGIDTDKNDLLMDLGSLMPPPHIRGKVTAVKLLPNAIVTYFGDGVVPAATPEEVPGGFMSFQGNPIRFGKLVMESADLVIYDLDPDDPLDWDQDHYRDQLVAGYSKVTPAMGLRAYAKDYNKLPRGAAAANSAAPPPSTAVPN